MKKTIRALVVPVGKPPEVQEIEPTLAGMYAVCGSPIQMVPYGGVDLICNEEGKLGDGLEPNRVVWEGADVIFGQFFFVRHNDEGETTSLTDEDITRLKAEFR